MSLAELFPPGGHRFRLTLRHGDPAGFFRSRDPAGGVLAERARWLAAEPSRHAALTPEGEALRAEFAAMTLGWGLDCGDTVEALGAGLEPDVLFLSPDETGAFRLRGGALCFPTGWALEEKIGQPLEAIHGVVPGLNPALGSPIRQFLAKLKPGVAFFRDNWGLAATDELNLHPARRIPAPQLPVALDRLWLRVEHQALAALPRSGGVVFGIRVSLHRLDAIAAEPSVAGALASALLDLPEPLAAYKRVLAIRDELARALNDR